MKPTIHRQTWGCELHPDGDLFIWDTRKNVVVKLTANEAIQLRDLLNRNFEVLQEALKKL